MATPFSNVYSRFLAKVSDFDLANLTDLELEEILKGYMESAIVKFYRCKTDLNNRDEISFLDDLSLHEQEIIATGMLIEYLTPQINAIENLKQMISGKDFRFYSQSRHLRELIFLRDTAKKEFDKMILDYTYLKNKLDDMR